jgi:hypothetical protein
MTSRTLTAAYRWHVAARTAVAVVGAFAFASALSILLATVLTRMDLVSRAAAVHGATLLGFVVWCGAVMWAYSPASVWRVGLLQFGWALALGGLAWFIGFGGAT